MVAGGAGRQRAARMAEAVRRAVLDGRFPTTDDGGGDDDGGGRAAGGRGVLSDERSGGADLGERGPVRSSAARLRHGARLSGVHAQVPVAVGGGAAARRRERAGADGHGARRGGRGADLVRAVVELCGGHGSGRAGGVAVRRAGERVLAAGDADVRGRHRPDVHLAGSGGVHGRDPSARRAGGGVGADDRHRLRRGGGDDHGG